MEILILNPLKNPDDNTTDWKIKKKQWEDDFTNVKERNGITKEIQRIQTRLNNYNYKYDIWK